MYLCGAYSGFVQQYFKETTGPHFVTFLTSSFPWQYLPWKAVMTISFLIGDSDVTTKSWFTCPSVTLIKVSGVLWLCSSSSAANFQNSTRYPSYLYRWQVFPIFLRELLSHFGDSAIVSASFQHLMEFST